MPALTARTATGSDLERSCTNRHLLLVSTALFVAAFAFRLIVVFAIGMYRDITPYELERTAISLATKGVYGNPFFFDTGPTAHVVPGYTLLLAAIYKLLGVTVAGETAKVVLSCIAASLRSALLPWFAARVGLKARTGLLAGVFSVLWIGPLETELKGGWESPYTALFLLILTARHFVRPLGKQTPAQAVFTGVLWGALFLLNPSAVLVLAAFFLLDLYRSRQWLPPVLWRNGAMIAGAVFLILLPWGLRNRAALGSFILTRSNFGLELYVSYHPGAVWDNLGNVQGLESVHPAHNPHEAARIRELGEVAYNREKLEMALDWIRVEPGEAARLAFLHFLRFWFPPGRTALYTNLLWLLTVFAVCGYLVLWRGARDLALHMGALLVSFPLMYYVVSWSSRYRDPIEWALVLLAAIFVNFFSGFMLSTFRTGSN